MLEEGNGKFKEICGDVECLDLAYGSFLKSLRTESLLKLVSDPPEEWHSSPFLLKEAILGLKMNTKQHPVPWTGRNILLESPPPVPLGTFPQTQSFSQPLRENNPGGTQGFFGSFCSTLQSLPGSVFGSGDPPIELPGDSDQIKPSSNTFEPYIEQITTVSHDHYHCVAAFPEYRKFSLEEMRLFHDTIECSISRLKEPSPKQSPGNAQLTSCSLAWEFEMLILTCVEIFNDIKGCKLKEK